MTAKTKCAICGKPCTVDENVIEKTSMCEACGKEFASVDGGSASSGEWAATKNSASVAPPPLPQPSSSAATPFEPTENAVIVWIFGPGWIERIYVCILLAGSVIALLANNDVAESACLLAVLGSMIYFMLSAYATARVAGRNGLGIVQMLIPFYIIPFSINNWPIMRLPIARQIRSFVLLALTMMLLIHSAPVQQ